VATVEASVNGTSEIQSSRDRFFDECIGAWEEFMEARRLRDTPMYFKGDDCNLDALLDINFSCDKFIGSSRSKSLRKRCLRISVRRGGANETRDYF
jgi:hypothetical protein